MHIPDGFLSPPVWAALDVVSVPAVGFMARRAQRTAADRAPLLGVMGAFVFAAQMINFPVGLGTSGHLVGGALLACTLGPAAASMVMTAILVVQALVFQDGGVLALGANVLNMALIGVMAGYLPYRYWANTPLRRAGVFLGGFLSVLVGASLAMAQLAASGVSFTGPVLAVSAGLFVVTAVLEGLITLAVFEAVERLNPGWVNTPAGAGSRATGLLAAAAVLLAAVGVLVASGSPDGLENLAEQSGIASRAVTLFTTPLTDYEWKAAGGEWLSKAGAGLAGLAVIYVLCSMMGRLIGRPRNS
ncbi:MAG: cobalamin biosynthesis protein CbiM [Acidobacteria bacterium]|nr:cobalamin biosynthesis protein CbiM [Acidobacteriota bacterium]